MDANNFIAILEQMSMVFSRSGHIVKSVPLFLKPKVGSTTASSVYTFILIFYEENRDAITRIR